MAYSKKLRSAEPVRKNRLVLTRNKDVRSFVAIEVKESFDPDYMLISRNNVKLFSSLPESATTKQIVATSTTGKRWIYTFEVHYLAKDDGEEKEPLLTTINITITHKDGTGPTKIDEPDVLLL